MFHCLLCFEGAVSVEDRTYTFLGWSFLLLLFQNGVQRLPLSENTEVHGFQVLSRVGKGRITILPVLDFWMTPCDWLQ